jgi:hypothetical protein
MVQLALAFMFLFLAPSQNEARNAKAIEKAKQTSVHQIENSLPDKAFEQWLLELVGPNAQVVWDVNDCGEQTGDPSIDHARDIPMCVDSQVTFKGSKKLHIVLGIGSIKTGVSPEPATFRHAVFVQNNGAQDWSVKKLSQLPEAIKTMK